MDDIVMACEIVVEKINKHVRYRIRKTRILEIYLRQVPTFPDIICFMTICRYKTSGKS